jgi:hypothetical protein
MGESGVDLLSHTVKCNIIGAVSFHGPVRDGKGWDQDAMDTRLKGVRDQERDQGDPGGMPLEEVRVGCDA